MDDLLSAHRRPRILVSSTGFPDLTKKISIGADEMLVNAINQMNRKSRAYVFLDQSLEKDWGQITLLTRQKDDLEPQMYIRAAITQVDQGVVSDSVSLGLDFTNAPNAWSPFKAKLNGSQFSAGRDVSVVTVDMHLVSYATKTIIPGSSVANTMVVTADNRGAQADGLIRLTGFDFSIKVSRIESLGQAVRNLVELGVIELLGRHARVPYWQCLNIRPSNQKLDNLDELRFLALPRAQRIRKVQAMLASLGYRTGATTGSLGPKTRAAISRFQANEKLVATGELNYQLFALLSEKTNGYNRDRKPVPDKPAKNKSPDILLIPDRTNYRKGDILKLELDVRKDGFVRCFHQSGKGPIVQILPLTPGRFIQISRGSRVSIPGQKAQFDIQFETSGAEESVLCVLSPDNRPPPPKTAAKSTLEPVPARSFEEISRYYRRIKKPFSTAEFRTRARQ
jgi:peptidoglycan hydrolase-like protein with peptidoglycan-binding domain